GRCGRAVDPARATARRWLGARLRLLGAGLTALAAIAAGSGPTGSARRAAGTVRPGGGDPPAGPDLVLALDDHLLAAVEALADHGDVPGGQRDRHRLHLRDAVGADGVDERALRAALDGDRRDHDRVLAG